MEKIVKPWDKKKKLGLTKRHIQILNLLKLGYTNKAIANELDTATETIRTTISVYILPRLGAQSRTHAVYIGMKKGLIK